MGKLKMGDKDIFFVDFENKFKFNGFLDETFQYIEDFQLLNPKLWERFVGQFREDADHDGGWRGEYWGKTMRGATFVYSYTKNPELYEILKKTVLDMIDSADNEGRISSYYKNHEFEAWDMWSRKYVLLGMEYFLEICEDEDLEKKVIASMKAQVDYIISKIGKAEDGKKEITLATRHWRGLNSCSILEPIVRLYNLTGEKKYFDFAEYIVDCGGTDVVNIFKLAHEDKLYPYQYPITKAYEMTSCFEGLLEFYRITGVEWYKEAILRYADKILESDFTVIGCSGCTHELFDHSTVRQANTNNGKIMQETCVTVTLMKFFYQLTRLSGDPRYVDAFETSLYNAYLGAVNTEKVIEPQITNLHPDWEIEALPFDSYSPLTAGTRGNGVGGLMRMSDNHYYGCCACIGAAGIGMAAKMNVLTNKSGLTVNLFIDGKVETKTPDGEKVTLLTRTDYPKTGDIKITLELEKPAKFELLIRNPDWSKTTEVLVNGENVEVNNGYIIINREWVSGDTIDISLDMRTQAIYPIPYGHQVLMNEVIWGHNYVIPTYDEEDPIAKNHIALRRGPIMLAQENRLGYSVDDAVTVDVKPDGYVDVELTDEGIPYKYIVGAKVPLKNGKKMTVTDYSSAGKLWNEESKMAVWMKTE